MPRRRPRQKEALGLLYSRTDGAGLTILRDEISADAGATIEPTAPGSPTVKPAYLPLSAINDDDGQLWFAQTIKRDYGVTDVFADAWSAPAFMKTNDSVDNGGTLCGVPGAACATGDWRQAYANYLTRYAKDYAAAGDSLSYVGPENEADIGPDYDSMIMSPDQTADFLDYLGPTMARSGLPTGTECCATEGWDYAQTPSAHRCCQRIQHPAPLLWADPSTPATVAATSPGSLSRPRSANHAPSVQVSVSRRPHRKRPFTLRPATKSL